jgi:hypothetical protein
MRNLSSKFFTSYHTGNPQQIYGYPQTLRGLFPIIFNSALIDKAYPPPQCKRKIPEKFGSYNKVPRSGSSFYLREISENL